ncbi:outer membrane beta-barrel protein [Flavihumibacter profundi]|jgi:hypothetical protein|uniref:outer membrane beta-barrel protein n=1 Tax=Flavihumibacter profundi TaxID=2716883 RepID=UPI001CC5EFB2|nr:outer membrane beta-barrel protein [Flavihumibacter profundi]MBZ5856964.1 outer membrane beta-barrel protein [Flavihumibacter profundi]
MKKKILVSLLMLVTMRIFAQNNMVTISGGYSSANIEDVDARATGWRLNGLYEFKTQSSKVAQGLSIGYMSIAATSSSADGKITSTINSIPIYYAPKYLFGKDKFKGFVKGALGMQFASLKREGALSVSSNDFGFYGGAGAGIMLFISEKIFVNGEYEIAWASNSWYRDGWISSAMGGIGVRF